MYAFNIVENERIKDALQTKIWVIMLTVQICTDVLQY